MSKLCQILMFIALTGFVTANSEEQLEEISTEDVLKETLESPTPIVVEPSNPGLSDDGDVLLLQWVPHPINQYRYIIQNLTTGLIHEEGMTTTDKLTRNAYPDVRFALAVVPGDGEYIFLDGIPLISVDAFRDDRYFQDYQDIIFTIHNFDYKVHLWSHFLRYPDAFDVVRYRLSSAFQGYFETSPDSTQPPPVIYENPDDFDQI